MKPFYCKACVWGIIIFAIVNGYAFRYLSRTQQVAGAPIAIFDHILMIPSEFTLYARTSESVKNDEITFLAKNTKLILGHDTYKNTNLLLYIDKSKKVAKEYCGVNVIEPVSAGDLALVYTVDDFILLIGRHEDVLTSIVGQLCRKNITS